MADAFLSFPHGFLWGTATSSYQVEGNNTNNDWYAWEENDHIIGGDKCGTACDWWGGRWREDFDRAYESGQNAHRLSVEWSRIQPSPERWDENAIDHYRQMVRGLKDRGLTTMVTLHHFTDPLWLSEMGGWENESVSHLFQEFVGRVVKSLHEYVDFWCTFNEPNVLTYSSYLFGDFPPGKKNFRSAYHVVRNIIKSHILAYDVIHQSQPDAQVGLAHHYRGFTPKNSWFLVDRFLSRKFSRNFNDIFPQTLHSGVMKFFGVRSSFPNAKNTQDFFGLNYYTRENVSFSLSTPKDFFCQRGFHPEVERSPGGLVANEPKAFYQGLNWANNFCLPIYVTENGIDDTDDSLRPKFLCEHIHQMWQGVNFNWPIKGYFHWSLVDNFEWEHGWSHRFGLWELDIETQTRRKRKSAELYEVICNDNGLSSSMVSEFVPELKEAMFPG